MQVKRQKHRQVIATASEKKSDIMNNFMEQQLKASVEHTGELIDEVIVIDI